MTTQIRRYRIYGRVQGVCYRDFVRRTAGALGLQGWVRNRLDGTVEALLEGSVETLDRAQAELRTGPSLSSVERVECHEEALDSGPLIGFQVRQTV